MDCVVCVSEIYCKCEGFKEGVSIMCILKKCGKYVEMVWMEMERQWSSLEKRVAWTRVVSQLHLL